MDWPHFNGFMVTWTPPVGGCWVGLGRLKNARGETRLMLEVKAEEFFVSLLKAGFEIDQTAEKQ